MRQISYLCRCPHNPPPHPIPPTSPPPPRHTPPHSIQLTRPNVLMLFATTCRRLLAHWWTSGEKTTPSPFVLTHLHSSPAGGCCPTGGEAGQRQPHHPQAQLYRWPTCTPRLQEVAGPLLDKLGDDNSIIHELNVLAHVPLACRRLPGPWWTSWEKTTPSPTSSTLCWR